MANGTQLYDANSQPIYPFTYGRNVESGVVIGGNTVYDDLKALLDQLRTLRTMITGGYQLANSLGVRVGFAISASNSKSEAETLTYQEDFVLPSENAPYTWQRTQYYWDNDLVKTIYTIVATALYPETQIMYTALATVIPNTVKGPSDYGANVNDQNANNIVWHNYFPGIGPQQPFGYMAVRHRDAGKAFPLEENKPVWNISLFAMYPMTS